MRDVTDVDILIICDGMADAPGLLEYVPSAMSRLRHMGCETLVNTVGSGLDVTSENAISTIIGGHDAPYSLPGRGALEALGMGIDPGSGMKACRFDSHCRDLTYEEGHILAQRLQSDLPSGYRVLEGRGFRHVLLRQCGLPVPDVDGMYAWGDSVLPSALPPVIDSVMVAGVPVAHGIALCMGWQAPVISGTDGSIDTDYAAKARATIEWLERGAGRVVVHIEAPDEMSHLRRPDLKRIAIDRIDNGIVAPLLDYALSRQLTLTVMSDHATSPHTGRHLRGPVSAITLHT